MNDHLDMLLEQQRLYNETLSDVNIDVDSYQFLQTFRNTSKKMVERIYSLIKTPYLVSFNPIDDPMQLVGRHPLKTVLYDLDEISHISYDVALEIDQFVISDLRRDAGTVGYVDPSYPNTDFSLFYKHILGIVEEKCGHFPNWVVASSDVCAILKQTSESWQLGPPDGAMPLGLRVLGNIGDQMLFENTFAPEGELLAGYLGTEPTYEFRPKILLEVSPEKVDNSKVRKARLFTQFDIRKPDNGGNSYARINLKAPD